MYFSRLRGWKRISENQFRALLALLKGAKDYHRKGPQMKGIGSEAVDIVVEGHSRATGEYNSPDLWYSGDPVNNRRMFYCVEKAEAGWSIKLIEDGSTHLVERRCDMYGIFGVQGGTTAFALSGDPVLVIHSATLPAKPLLPEMVWDESFHLDHPTCALSGGIIFAVLWLLFAFSIWAEPKSLIAIVAAGFLFPVGGVLFFGFGFFPVNAIYRKWKRKQFRGRSNVVPLLRR